LVKNHAFYARVLAEKSSLVGKYGTNRGEIYSSEDNGKNHYK
jgi:hypothetical protein